MIDDLFTEWERDDGPGCAVVARRGGTVVARGDHGLADLAAGTPIGPDSVFYIASVSKHLTAACVFLLAADGALDLDDDVRRHVPELPDHGQPLTVRQLIHHTSGLRDVLDLWASSGRGFDEPMSNADAVAMICRQRGLNFAPGTRHLYCNSGYTLMAEIVARLSGSSLRCFAEAHIFAPLGMADTRFDDDNADCARRVRSYRPAGGDAGGYDEVRKAFTIVGSGGVLTTTDDLCRWDANFDDPRVGGARLIEALTTPGVLADGTAIDYAGGLVVGSYKGLRTVQHAGGMLGFRAHFLRVPEQATTVICLGNVTSFDAKAQALAVADRLLADAYDLVPYAGTWVSAELDASYAIQVDGVDLVLTAPARLTGVLRAQDGDTFVCDAGELGRRQLRFTRDAAGSVDGLVLDSGRARGMRFVRG